MYLKIQESPLIRSIMKRFSRTYQQNIISVSILSNFKKSSPFYQQNKNGFKTFPMKL